MDQEMPTNFLISRRTDKPLAEATEISSAQTLHPRVVIADDSGVSLATLQRLLVRLGFTPQLASNGAAAWRLLEESDVPTIAILDWLMPEIEGIEICRRLRKLQRQHYTYTMLLTCKSQKREVIEGLQAGADDYMTKPFDAAELQARLVVAQRIMAFQEELFAAREILRQKAHQDYLTQLLNRAGIMEALAQELGRSRRTHEPFSVVLVDIDHFKKINDTFGHLTGDDVLFETACRLRNCMRTYDHVGRYGGEEFLLVVPGCDHRQAFQLGEKIRQSICESPIQTSGFDQTVTVSVGVCARTTENTPEALLAAADTALYSAKRGGRNRTELFSSASRESAPSFI
jgi:diguanylate cyclase (GGDEF)-like protein